MRRPARLWIAMLMIVCFNSFIFAQKDAEKVKEAMLKFGWIAGRWQGDVQYFTGQDSGRTLKQTMMSAGKLNGTIILIEGNAVDLHTDPDIPRVVYEAMAVLSHDLVTKKFLIHSFRDGRYHEAEAIPNKIHGFDWGFDVPTGKVKFSMGLDPDGSWKETGHFSRDGGKTWVKTYEVVLARVLRREEM